MTREQTNNCIQETFHAWKEAEQVKAQSHPEFALVYALEAAIAHDTWQKTMEKAIRDGFEPV